MRKFLYILVFALCTQINTLNAGTTGSGAARRGRGLLRDQSRGRDLDTYRLPDAGAGEHRHDEGTGRQREGGGERWVGLRVVQ